MAVSGQGALSRREYMLGLLALVTASIFFGAAMYINIAEHPARMGLPDGAALAEWGPAYRRGFDAGCYCRRFSAARRSRLVDYRRSPVADWCCAHDRQLAVHVAGYHADQSRA